MRMKALIVTIGMASVMLISSIGVTYASFTSSDSKVNDFVDGNVELDITENFRTPIVWNGNKYTKEVKVTNKSNVPALIRVAVYPRWITGAGNLWAGDSDFVHLEFTDDIVIPSANDNTQEKWIKDNNDDSKIKYYYYNTILQPNVETKELIKSVTLALPDELKVRYKNKFISVDVKAETVLATQEAYKAAWSDIDNSEISAILDKICTK